MTLRLWADGTGEVIVEGVAAPISAGALRAARAQGLAQVQQLFSTTADEPRCRPSGSSPPFPAPTRPAPPSAEVTKSQELTRQFAESG